MPSPSRNIPTPPIQTQPTIRDTFFHIPQQVVALLPTADPEATVAIPLHP